MRVDFGTAEEAISHCERNGWRWFVDQPQAEKKARVKNYGINFAWNKRTRVSTKQLLIAADGGDIGTIKTLIESGADVDFVDNDGNTALHYAASRDRLEVVRLLVQQMTDVSVENNCRLMPLDLARKRGDVVIVDAIEEQILKNSLAVLKE
ncbi:hypothetical protein pipiens_017759, partial [Culex pipiens pipiens]